MKMNKRQKKKTLMKKAEKGKLIVGVTGYGRKLHIGIIKALREDNSNTKEQ